MTRRLVWAVFEYPISLLPELAPDRSHPNVLVCVAGGTLLTLSRLVWKYLSLRRTFCGRTTRSCQTMPSLAASCTGLTGLAGDSDFILKTPKGSKCSPHLSRRRGDYFTHAVRSACFLSQANYKRSPCPCLLLHTTVQVFYQALVRQLPAALMGMCIVDRFMPVGDRSPSIVFVNWKEITD